MQKRIIKIIASLFVIVCGIFVVGQNYARAGFGISPPYVKTNRLIPGSHYEQMIILLRSSADEKLRAEISVVAPEISSWVTLEKGESFDLPVGQLQVPMIIKVDVPEDAELGNYRGYINVRVAPGAGAEGGGVAIALGARIDIDLTVTNEAFPDFLVRTVSIPDFEVLSKPWNWPIFARFFYKIKLVMKIENTGNIDVAPTKAHIDVYDIAEKELLEAHDDKSVANIRPYATEDVVAAFPTKLPPGQYWGRIKIYKDNEVVRGDKIAFTVYPSGGLAGYSAGLGIWPWALLSGYILLALSCLFALVKIRIWRHFFKILFILSWPARFAGGKIRIFARILKIKFWRWIHQKSVRYQEGGREAGARSRTSAPAGGRLDLSNTDIGDNDDERT